MCTVSPLMTSPYLRGAGNVVGVLARLRKAARGQPIWEQPFAKVSLCSVAYLDSFHHLDGRDDRGTAAGKAIPVHCLQVTRSWCLLVEKTEVYGELNGSWTRIGVAQLYQRLVATWWNAAESCTLTETLPGSAPEVYIWERDRPHLGFWGKVIGPRMDCGSRKSPRRKFKFILQSTCWRVSKGG
jgi:hypothetical protein